MTWSRGLGITVRRTSKSSMVIEPIEKVQEFKPLLQAAAGLITVPLCSLMFPYWFVESIIPVKGNDIGKYALHGPLCKANICKTHTVGIIWNNNMWLVGVGPQDLVVFNIIHSWHTTENRSIQSCHLSAGDFIRFCGRNCNEIWGVRSCTETFASWRRISTLHRRSACCRIFLQCTNTSLVDQQVILFVSDCHLLASSRL